MLLHLLLPILLVCVGTLGQRFNATEKFQFTVFTPWHFWESRCYFTKCQKPHRYIPSCRLGYKGIGAYRNKQELKGEGFDQAGAKFGADLRVDDVCEGRKESTLCCHNVTHPRPLDEYHGHF